MRHPERFKPLKPHSIGMRTLASMVEQRRALTDDKTRFTNRLGDTLKQYYPQALEWFDHRDTICCFINGASRVHTGPNSVGHSAPPRDRRELDLYELRHWESVADFKATFEHPEFQRKSNPILPARFRGHISSARLRFHAYAWLANAGLFPSGVAGWRPHGLDGSTQDVGGLAREALVRAVGIGIQVRRGRKALRIPGPDR